MDFRKSLEPSGAKRIDPANVEILPPLEKENYRNRCFQAIGTLNALKELIRLGIVGKMNPKTQETLFEQLSTIEKILKGEDQ